MPGYGLSEATNFSCILPVDLSDSQYRAAFSRASVSPIGAAIPEATISIRNGSEIVQGEGVEGEICVSGPHLMNGYLTGVQPISEGVLRTGDLGLYFDFEFGRIFYLTGRLKEVVKRSGVSISLREIDDILIPHLPPGIDLASVGFENDYTGEEIGLAVEVAGQLDRGRIVDLLVKACSLLPFETRPKVLVMIQSGGPAMRTESGKPLRRNFVQYFSNFKTQILTGGIRVVDLVSS